MQNFFNGLLRFAGWFFFVVLFFVSINFFQYNHTIGGLIVLLISLVCLPPFAKVIFTQQARKLLKQSFTEGASSIKKDFQSLPARVYNAPKNISQSAQSGGLKNLSVLAFIIANNIVPLVGIACFNWSPVGVVLLYFFEVCVIGFLNIIKIFITYNGSLIFIAFNLVVFCPIYFIFIYAFGSYFFPILLNSTISDTNITYLFINGAALFLQHVIFLIQYAVAKKYLTTPDNQPELYAPLKYIHVLIICFAIGATTANGVVIALVIAKLCVDIYNWHADLKKHTA